MAATQVGPRSWAVAQLVWWAAGAAGHSSAWAAEPGAAAQIHIAPPDRARGERDSPAETICKQHNRASEDKRSPLTRLGGALQHDKPLSTSFNGLWQQAPSLGARFAETAIC